MLNSSSWYDYSDSVVYNADIVSIAVITVSILGFPIIFSVATWLSTQSKIPFPEEATTEGMLRYLIVYEVYFCHRVHREHRVFFLCSVCSMARAIHLRSAATKTFSEARYTLAQICSFIF